MADTVEGLPEALAKRQQLVTLSDGSTLMVEEWSWSKLLQLYQMIGDATKAPAMIEASVRAEDRAKAAGLSAADLGKVAVAIVRQNQPAVKNLIALGLLVGKTTEGEAPNTP